MARQHKEAISRRNDRLMENGIKLSKQKPNKTLRKHLRMRSVISVNYHYITVLSPFNLLIRFKCYNTV